MVYIRQQNLHGLKEYKYAGVDHSLLSRYILKPFYTNVAIKCFPMSMAWVLTCSTVVSAADVPFCSEAQMLYASLKTTPPGYLLTLKTSRLHSLALVLL